MLSEKEFIEVLKVMTYDWYKFGHAMGMSTTDLDIIKARSEVEQYMQEMLQKWLETGSATWEKLQEALRDIGSKGLAGELASELAANKVEQQQRKQLQYCYPCMCTGVCFDCANDWFKLEGAAILTDFVSFINHVAVRIFLK